MSAGFETQPCSRCGGTGHYSYCQRFGTVCFKCRGAKVVYTKRGAAAYDFYRQSFPTKPATDLLVGDRFNSSGITEGGDVFGTVETVIEAPQMSGDYSVSRNAEGIEDRRYYLSVLTANRQGQRVYHGMFPDTEVRVIPSAEIRAQLKAAALAYQDTLTKAGTPRRTGAK